MTRGDHHVLKSCCTSLITHVIMMMMMMMMHTTASSYKWSEVYSADAYAIAQDQEAIHRYRDTILTLGGGTDPNQVWRSFCGREEADVSALLRQEGLAS